MSLSLSPIKHALTRNKNSTYALDKTIPNIGSFCAVWLFI